MHKSILFYIAIAGIISAVLLTRDLRTQVPPAPPLSPPPISPFANAIGGQGILEGLGNNVRIAPPAPGLVTDVYVSVNDVVTSGQPLFRLDSRESAADVAVKNAQIFVAEAAVLEAESAVADRRDQVKRNDPLARQNVVSEDQTIRLAFQLKLAESILAKSKAELKLARANADFARTRLDTLTVRAPRDGRVLRFNIRAGEYVTVNDSAGVLLGDAKHLQLRADVDELNAPQVRPGAKAIGYAKGNAGTPVPLEFLEVEPYITPKLSLTGSSGERVDTRVLQVIFKVGETTMPLYAGQQMDVYLEASPPQ